MKNIHNYFTWNEITIDDFSSENIIDLYAQGYLFGRPHKGYMYQTRSVRIDLSKFEMNSENRRVLRKAEQVGMKIESLPMKSYHWKIAKLAKDFYDTKFGRGVFSANKIKEMLSSADTSNFNMLLSFHEVHEPPLCIAHGTNPPIKMSDVKIQETTALGYVICYTNDDILHYSYPFYIRDNSSSPLSLPASLGMPMMLKAIQFAQDTHKKYIYLGSALRPTDTYKLQFKGLEWFDGEKWCVDTDKLKKELKK